MSTPIAEDFSDIAARLKQIGCRVISVRRLDKARFTVVHVVSWKPVAPVHQGDGSGLTVGPSGIKDDA